MYYSKINHSLTLLPKPHSLAKNVAKGNSELAHKEEEEERKEDKETRINKGNQDTSQLSLKNSTRTFSFFLFFSFEAASKAAFLLAREFLGGRSEEFPSLVVWTVESEA